MAGLAVVACLSGPERGNDAAERQESAQALLMPTGPALDVPPSASPAPPELVEPAVVPRTVVLVVIDGARWQEIFGGADPKIASFLGLPKAKVVDAEELVPTLHRLIDHGGAAIGAPGRGAELVASGPAFMSLPGYMEIFSGRPASDCPNNRCPAIAERTLVDDLADQPGVEVGDLAVFSSWPGVARTVAADPRRAVISAGRSAGHNLDRLDGRAAELLAAGSRSSSYPGHDGYRPDMHTAALALEHLRTHRPRFMLLSLGDADAFGHAGFYGRYLESLTESDRVVGEISRTLASLRESGWPSTLLVTADHGRDRRCRDHGAQAPESARSWLVAHGTGIADVGAVHAAGRRRLADIAPTVRALFGMPEDSDVRSGSALSEILSAPPLRRTAQALPSSGR